MKNQDLEYLRILSIFYYVVAGIAALFACFPIIHLSVGVSMLTGGFFGPDMPQDESFPFVLFGLMFTIIPAIIILSGLAYAICMVAAGYFLGQRQRYIFCMVMAAISCVFMPFGTVLGIFTILLLARPSVKELFEANP